MTKSFVQFGPARNPGSCSMRRACTSSWCPAAGGYGDSSTVSRRELQETKKKCISLGSYPEISLVQARERRDAARRDVGNGIDPSLRRMWQKICLGNTFEAVVREFIGVLRAANINPEGSSPAAAQLIQQTLTPSHLHRRRSREPISANTVDTLERRLELHVFPYIGTRDVQLLHAPELLEVLRRIECGGTYDLARSSFEPWNGPMYSCMAHRRSGASPGGG